MTKYKVGSTVTGNITGIEKYGAFVSLDDYYSGLIHISEISEGFVNDINDYVNLGETISAKIIEVDDESCHVKLSIKNIKSKPNRRKRNIEEVGSGFGILKENLDRCVRIPMSDKVRSLNLSNCAALTIYEVLRQQDYPNLSKVEVQKGEEFLYDL